MERTMSKLWYEYPEGIARDAAKLLAGQVDRDCLRRVGEAILKQEDAKLALTADGWRDPMPWVPMNSPRDIKVVGKFLEELGEGVSAGARSLIQGLDEAE